MVPIVGAGLDREVTLTFDEGIVSGRVVVVPAGVPRAVDAGGERLAVMPVDPVMAPAAVVDEQATLTELGVLAEGLDTKAWDRLGDAVGLHLLHAGRPAAVEDAMSALAASSDENLPAEAIAAEVGMSLSRLQHLFSETVGTTMRSFRTWHRFRSIALHVQSGRTLTEAAHASGFYDSAHFTNTFTKTFGITPSFVFSDDLRIFVVDE